MNSVCVETERRFAKSRNHAVMRQWPELALMENKPDAAAATPKLRGGQRYQLRRQAGAESDVSCRPPVEVCLVATSHRVSALKLELGATPRAQ